jgi:hypothetical protein
VIKVALFIAEFFLLSVLLSRLSYKSPILIRTTIILISDQDKIPKTSLQILFNFHTNHSSNSDNHLISIKGNLLHEISGFPAYAIHRKSVESGSEEKKKDPVTVKTLIYCFKRSRSQEENALGKKTRTESERESVRRARDINDDDLPK